MTQPSKEPCKKQACEIRAFLPQRCVGVIQLLQSCCEQCDYKSTSEASWFFLFGRLKWSRFLVNIMKSRLS